MKPLVIYHGNCADGFTAAWAVWKVLGIAADYYPGVYMQPPPDVTGRRVILVDFSYKRPMLEKMLETAKSILILDHHKTAAADLEGYPEPCQAHPDHPELGGWLPDTGIYALFDMERSGAKLAWDYFHPGKRVPKLVRYVQDRDLWKFELPDSREVNAPIFSHEYTWQNWDDLDKVMSDDRGIAEISLEGRAIERKHFKDINELLKVCQHRMVIGGYDVPVASLPYTMSSDAGHIMAQGEPFAACYWDTPKGRTFSLRSSEKGVDVSDIAKQYGGGGHKNAAGFSAPKIEIEKLALLMNVQYTKKEQV